MSSLEIIIFMVEKEPHLKTEIQNHFFNVKPLSRKDIKSIRQKMIENASLSWKPEIIQ